MPERLLRKEHPLPLDQEPAKEQAEQVAPQENLAQVPSSTVSKALPLFPSPPQAALALEQEEKKAIEKVLAEGLDDVYNHMDSQAQKNFKKQGEVTALTIQKMLHSAKVQVQKIFGLILTWLRLIPKVNKFFLEQEAKIKTDKILALKP